MSVEITGTSKHSRTKMGSATPSGQTLGKTTLGHSQYSIAYGKRSKRKSMTIHCSHEAAQETVKLLQSQGH